MPQIWHVYHVAECRHAKPTPKPKFVVIVCRDSKFMGFLINTNIHLYIQKRPELLSCQAVIDKANHNFLNYDSYVDCVDLYEFEDAELISPRGIVATKVKKDILRAVAGARTIEPYYKRLIK